MARVVAGGVYAGSDSTSSNSKNSCGSGRLGLSAPTRGSSSARREKSSYSSRSTGGPSPRHRGCDDVNEDHASRSASSSSDEASTFGTSPVAGSVQCGKRCSPEVRNGSAGTTGGRSISVGSDDPDSGNRIAGRGASSGGPSGRSP